MLSATTERASRSAQLLDSSEGDAQRAFDALNRCSACDTLLRLFRDNTGPGTDDVTMCAITETSFLKRHADEWNKWTLMQWIFCSSNITAPIEVTYQSYVRFFVQYLIQCAITESSNVEDSDYDFADVAPLVCAKIDELSALISTPSDITREAASELLQITPSQWDTLRTRTQERTEAAGPVYCEEELQKRLAESDRVWSKRLSMSKNTSLMSAMSPPIGDGSGPDKYWTSCDASAPHSLVDVPLTSHEGGFIVQRFMTTVQGARVVSIVRNQNFLLWHRFASYRFAMEHSRAPPAGHANRSACAPSVAPALSPKPRTQEFLFHGCREEHLQSILRDGVDTRLARASGMFGMGAYFARDASYSHNYSRSLPSSTSPSPLPKLMLLCRVVVGVQAPAVSGQATGMRKAPPGYDSIVSKDGRIFSVFENSASYPEYIITYAKDTATRQHTGGAFGQGSALFPGGAFGGTGAARGAALSLGGKFRWGGAVPVTPPPAGGPPFFLGGTTQQSVAGFAFGGSTSTGKPSGFPTKGKP